MIPRLSQDDSKMMPYSLKTAQVAEEPGRQAHLEADFDLPWCWKNKLILVSSDKIDAAARAESAHFGT